MTPKQIERIQLKIKNIRSILAKEKRMFGGYDDSYGRRYMTLALYIKIEDYRVGLFYTRWFAKNFPDDVGLPIFLFEWTLILFKNKKIIEAESKAIQTCFSNTYLFDKFFERPIVPLEPFGYSGHCLPEYANYLPYSKNQAGHADFADWLAAFEDTERFKQLKAKFLDLSIQLKSENNMSARRSLIRQISKLEKEI